MNVVTDKTKNAQLVGHDIQRRLVVVLAELADDCSTLEGELSRLIALCPPDAATAGAKSLQKIDRIRQISEDAQRALSWLSKHDNYDNINDLSSVIKVEHVRLLLSGAAPNPARTDDEIHLW